MTDAPDRLLDAWCRWIDKAIDCGTANIGAHTRREICEWAEHAERAGWLEDADLARAIADGGESTRARAERLLTSASRVEIARRLRLVEGLRD